LVVTINQLDKKNPGIHLDQKLSKIFLETDNPSLIRFNSVCQLLAKHLPLNSVPTASNKNNNPINYRIAMYL